MDRVTSFLKSLEEHRERDELRNTPENREKAFEDGKQSALKEVEAGRAIYLMDEMPSTSSFSDAGAMGWNSVVASDANQKLLKLK